MITEFKYCIKLKLYNKFVVALIKYEIQHFVEVFSLKFTKSTLLKHMLIRLLQAFVKHWHHGIRGT